MFQAFLNISNENAESGPYLVSTSKTLKGSPFTPVTQLVDGIYQRFPERALNLLRRPFILNYDPTLICRETLKVCAKRFRVEKDFKPAHVENLDFKFTADSSYQNFIGKVFSLGDASVMLQKEVSKLTSNSNSPLYERSRPVVALALSPDGHVLAMQKNQNVVSKNWHAEVLLVRNYFSRTQKLFPQGTQILTSLQSCRMCAAHLTLSSYEVFYLEADAGPYSKNTALTTTEKHFTL